MTSAKNNSKIYHTPNLVTLTNDLSSREEVENTLEVLLEAKVSPESTSVINLEKKSITIGMVRDLVAELSYASLAGKDRHIVLLYVDQFTLEAQNAVLKLLEEPPSRTQFWLFTQHPQQLLPTITSRANELSFSSSEPETQEVFEDDDTAAFLKNIPSMSCRELIEFAEKQPTKQVAQDFCDTAIKILHKQLSESVTTNNLKLIPILLEAKQHLHANVSPKLVLEHCFFELRRLHLSKG